MLRLIPLTPAVEPFSLGLPSSPVSGIAASKARDWPRCASSVGTGVLGLPVLLVNPAIAGTELFLANALFSMCPLSGNQSEVTVKVCKQSTWIYAILRVCVSVSSALCDREQRGRGKWVWFCPSHPSVSRYLPFISTPSLMSQAFPGPVGNRLCPVHSLSSIRGLGFGFFRGSRIENWAIQVLHRGPTASESLNLFLVISVSFPLRNHGSASGRTLSSHLCPGSLSLISDT